MNLTGEKLRRAVDAGIITVAQAEQLRLLWQEEFVESTLPSETKGTGFSNFLYYLGTLIVISAM